MEQHRAKYVIPVGCAKYVIPVGFVFRPEPEELLGFLVESIKLQDQWLRPPEIRYLDLYDKDSNPWTLFDGSSDQPFYVMTRLEKVAAGKSNIKRRAGTGTWKEQNRCDVAFRCQDGVELKGLKRNFAFVPEKDSGYSREKHGRWIMNEYSLLQDGFEDYVICEIHKKASSTSSSSSSKRTVDVYDDGETQNQVVMKKMRYNALSSSTTIGTNYHDDCDRDHQEVAMKKTQSSTCDDDDNDDDWELIDLIENQIKEGMKDRVACDSLALVNDSDHDRQGMISMASFDPFEHHDHDRDSIVKIDSGVRAKQSYPSPFDFPDEFWDFPGAGLPVDWQEPETSTSEHHELIGFDDRTPWDGLGFNFSGLDKDSASIGFDFTEGLWNY